MYPREYFPDLTTRARREEMDSEDLAAFDFLVGAMVAFLFLFFHELKDLGVVGVGRGRFDRFSLIAVSGYTA